MRWLIILVTVVICFTLLPYARRAYIDRRPQVVVMPRQNGKNRALHGKARIRERRER